MGATRSNEKYGRKKTTGTQSQPAADGRTPFAGFVNVTLTDAQRAHYKGWMENEELVQEAIEAVIDTAGKLSVSIDQRQGVFIGTVFVSKQGRPDAGLVLTMRGDTWYKALTRVVYVFDIVCAGDLSTRKTAQPDGWDDEKW